LPKKPSAFSELNAPATGVKEGGALDPGLYRAVGSREEGDSLCSVIRRGFPPLQGETLLEDNGLEAPYLKRGCEEGLRRI
jgi:hypothetical protein